ncbi:MAG: hypothetical protein D3926_02260 [Desulfobacteraceae bacterium]|nr:MAG: hypothetical protein D3926_02260 [Desulfobacteraceae bacterium]
MKSTQDTESLISHGDDSVWLITYADLMTLLLVFFVLLYTLAYFETNMYKSAIESIKVKVDQDADLIGLMELMEVPESSDTQITIEDITGLRSRAEALQKDFNALARRSRQSENINTRILDNKIIVTVKGQVIFRSGDAALSRTALPVFDEIVQILRDYPDYNINIKGHTDDNPIATGRFPSNWELSAIRATTVLKYLISKGVSPDRLTATGYADILPLVPNSSETNRAVNRRVEFVLEKKETF